MTRARVQAIDPRTELPTGAWAWSLDQPHSVGGRNYWTVDSAGVHVRDEPEPRRTSGAPLTLLRIQRCYGPSISAAAEAFGIAPQLLAAVVATESAGNEVAERYEPRLYDWSSGLCQTLTSTAAGMYRHTASVMGWPATPPADQPSWRQFLKVPRNSLALAAALLQALDKEFQCQGDPVLLYAAYNAGSDRAHTETAANHWGLVYYGGALDHFVAWYGDACSIPWPTIP